MIRLLVGHVLDRSREIPDESVHCAASSFPYWGLRAYGTHPQIWGGEEACEHEWGSPVRAPWANELPGPKGARVNRYGDASMDRSKLAGSFCVHCPAWLGELGQEPDPWLYVEHVVIICREIRRVLRSDGTFWLNLGTSYAGSGKGPTGHNGIGNQTKRQGFTGEEPKRTTGRANGAVPENVRRLGRGIRNGSGYELREPGAVPGFKPKDLIAIPWMVGLALQFDGWWLRSDNIWEKPNPMPESVGDRPTRSHEYVLLLTKAERYFYDKETVKEISVSTHPSGNGFKRPARLTFADRNGARGSERQWQVNGFRNRRSVWRIATRPSKEAHFATFPEDLPALCLKAGTSKRGCCPTCKAPWRRVTATQYVNPGNRRTNGDRYLASVHQFGGSAAFKVRLEARTVTLGWRPTCKHYADRFERELPRSKNPTKRHRQDKAKLWLPRGLKRMQNWPTVPAVAFDPFAGRGTTLKVADLLGLDAIGIELSKEYAEIAVEYLGRGAPLFTEVEVG